MESDLYEKTLQYFESIQTVHYCGTKIECSIFRELKDFRLVNNKYIYVSPPIPGVKMDNHDIAMNIFGSKYNQYYNEKYNINPWTEDSDETDSI